MRKGSQKDVQDNINQRHIISGWIYPPDDLVVSQFSLASLQRGVNLLRPEFVHDCDPQKVF